MLASEQRLSLNNRVPAVDEYRPRLGMNTLEEVPSRRHVFSGLAYQRLLQRMITLDKKLISFVKAAQKSFTR